MCFACLAAAVGTGMPDATRPGLPEPFPRETGPLPWAQGEPAGGTLRWTGNAGLRLDLDGVGVAFDPFVTRPGVFATLFKPPRPLAREVAARFGGLDAVFVGHTHYDHAMDLPAVAEASPTARIFGSRTTIELCRRLGVAPRRLVEVVDGDTQAVGPFEVETIASEHGIVPLVRHVDRLDLPRRGVPWTPFRYPRGAVYAFRVAAGGRTFHVQGSAGIHEEGLARQEPVDALLACLAARKGTPRYLERLGEVLRPSLLLPIHHDDFFRPLTEPARPVRTLDWPGFVEDARRLASAHGTRLVCPARDLDLAW